MVLGLSIMLVSQPLMNSSPATSLKRHIYIYIYSCISIYYIFIYIDRLICIHLSPMWFVFVFNFHHWTSLYISFVSHIYYCSWFHLIKFAQLVAPTFFPWRLMCDNQLKQPQNQKNSYCSHKKTALIRVIYENIFLQQPRNKHSPYIYLLQHASPPLKTDVGTWFGYSVSTGLYKYNCSVYVPKYNSGHDHRKKNNPSRNTWLYFRMSVFKKYVSPSTEKMQSRRALQFTFATLQVYLRDQRLPLKMLMVQRQAFCEGQPVMSFVSLR